MTEIAGTGEPTPASDPPAPAAEKGEPQRTDYVMLGQDDTGLWNEEGKVTAAGAEAAVRAHAERAGAGTYAAVPVRSWKPTTVVEKTETRLVFG